MQYDSVEEEIEAGVREILRAAEAILKLIPALGMVRFANDFDALLNTAIANNELNTPLGQSTLTAGRWIDVLTMVDKLASDGEQPGWINTPIRPNGPTPRQVILYRDPRSTQHTPPTTT